MSQLVLQQVFGHRGGKLAVRPIAAESLKVWMLGVHMVLQFGWAQKSALAARERALVWFGIIVHRLPMLAQALGTGQDLAAAWDLAFVRLHPIMPGAVLVHLGDGAAE